MKKLTLSEQSHVVGGYIFSFYYEVFIYFFFSHL